MAVVKPTNPVISDDPITAGMVLFAPFHEGAGTPTDLVSGLSFTGTPVWEDSPRGGKVKGVGLTYDTPTAAATSGGLTFLWAGSWDTFTFDGSMLFFEGPGGARPFVQLQYLRRTSTFPDPDNHVVRGAIWSPNQVFFGWGANYPTNGTVMTSIVRFSQGATIKLEQDGVVTYEQFTSNNTNFSDLGRIRTSAGQGCEVMGAWTRWLDDSEVAALFADPWLPVRGTAFSPLLLRRRRMAGRLV